MRRHRRLKAHANHERWLVSYADFITLLFAFFVVLYASSQVDKKKVGKLALAIQVAFQEMGVFQASTTEVPIDVSEPMPFSTAQAVNNVERSASLARITSHPGGSLGTGAEQDDLSDLHAKLESLLAAEIVNKEISVRSEADGLVISLREAGFFGSGSAQMKTASQPTFDRIAGVLLEGGYRLRIEGHTDNVPIHSAQFPSNWELSTARSTEVLRLLIVRNGFMPDRLSAAGYAEFHPVSTNRTAEGRNANRRVDLIVLGKGLGKGLGQTLGEAGQGATPTPPPVSPVSAQPGSTSIPAITHKPSPLQPLAVGSGGKLRR